jgi:rhodanese-related sulfurtransferase
MNTFAWVDSMRNRAWPRALPIACLALLVSLCACADGARPDAAQVRHAYDSGATFVDVRTDAEWSAGHVDGAVHLPVADVDAGAAAALPKKDQPIVLYCGTGRRAETAAESLRRQGYTQVTAMIGGYADLKAAGFPVAEGPKE